MIGWESTYFWSDGESDAKEHVSTKFQKFQPLFCPMFEVWSTWVFSTKIPFQMRLGNKGQKKMAFGKKSFFQLKNL